MNETDEQPREPVTPATLLQGAASTLAEHYDSVQIIATYRNSEGLTGLHHHGVGNWYAREGSVREWIKVQDARTREEAIHPADDE
jgi:hypothetical protein